MGSRINTIMQTCFFAISGVLPRDEAIAPSRRPSRRPTASAARQWCSKNFAAVDAALAHLHEVKVPEQRQLAFDIARSCHRRHAPSFVRDVLAPMTAGHGDLLPVSAMPADGTFPTGTAKWEKRNIAR